LIGLNIFIQVIEIATITFFSDRIKYFYSQILPYLAEAGNIYIILWQIYLG